MLQPWERVFETTTGPEHPVSQMTKPSLSQGSCDVPGAPGLIKQTRLV